MKLELDITKRLHNGSDEFRLRSCFCTSDKALVLFGPSGSGKTLTLRAIAGMLSPDVGVIRFNEEVLFDSTAGINVPTRKRNVGYVFQDYALFPHLNVRDNIGFGLKGVFGRLDKRAVLRIEELMEAFGLTKIASQKPASLSGGQQQRTALARALAPSPRLLLLDEPFSALDQPLRVMMRDELSRILAHFDIPMIMVTHDSDEAVSFAQSVIVYRNGHVVDVHSAQAVAEAGEPLAEKLIRQVAEAYG